jgi:dienelactone hydrolase
MIRLIPLFALLLPTLAMAKVMPFAPLTGPHKIGTTQYHFVDQSRPETFSSNPSARRHVTVQIWYPAEDNATGPTAPYLLSPEEFSALDADGATMLRFHEAGETRSLLRAPVAPGKHPLILFNPGGSMSRMSSSFVTEQLASHGYIVAAIEHYGDSKATSYPNGEPLGLDLAPDYTDPKLEARLQNGTATSDEIVEKSLRDWQVRVERVVPVAIEDTRFALLQLARLSHSTSPFRGRFDFSRIGTLGWSQGGAESIALLVHDARVKAAVDLDGQFMTPDREHYQTNKPFLLLHGSQAEDPNPVMANVDERLNAIVRPWFRGFMDRSTGPRFDAVIRDSDHGDFSDYLIFFGHSKAELRAHAQAREVLVSRLTVLFFDRYLKGTGADFALQDPLLESTREEGAR